MAGVVLVNSAGTPEPSPEIARRLRQVHGNLHLRYLGYTGQHWAVCMEWGENDRRRAWIKEQQYDPASAYDIIGWLPLDCPVEQAPSLVERFLRTATKEEYRKIAERVQAYNDDAPLRDAVEEAIAEVLDAADPSFTAPRKRGRPRKS